MDFTQRTDWEDLPSTDTPVMAADLLRIEQGVADARDELAGVVHSADAGTLVVLTQAAYDALTPPDPDTIYLISG